jgi:hypothetical protein
MFFFSYLSDVLPTIYHVSAGWLSEIFLMSIYLSSLSHMVGEHVGDGFAARGNYPNKETEHSKFSSFYAKC